MSIEEQRRARFEAAVINDFPLDIAEFLAVTPSREYRSPYIQARWRDWNAALDSVVIELPPVPAVPEAPEFALDDSHMDQYHAAIGMRHACAKFIEAAGVKVKP